MFFKKNISDTPQSQAQNAPTAATPNGPQDTSVTSSNSTKPVYQKPVLRRYDQIEQVKPYGPSEI